VCRHFVFFKGAFAKMDSIGAFAKMDSIGAFAKMDSIGAFAKMDSIGPRGRLLTYFRIKSFYPTFRRCAGSWNRRGLKGGENSGESRCSELLSKLLRYPRLTDDSFVMVGCRSSF
jgi:hypothetical protein